MARSRNETSEAGTSKGEAAEIDLNQLAESAEWRLFHKNEFAYAKQGTAEPAAEGEEAKPAPYTVVQLQGGEPSAEQVEAEQFEKEWVIVKGPTKDLVPPAPRRQDALDNLIEKAAAEAAKEQQAATAAA